MPAGRATGRAAIVGCAVVLLALPAAALAEDAPYVGWSSLLPGTATGHTPSSEPDCADGDPACVERTLDEMYRRYESLVASCNHNAVFALTYIRVTEEYRRAADAGFFDEPRFLAHEDRVFARMYFEAYDAWAADRRDAVPRAWLAAFDAGRDRAVSGAGNVLLGINAHVNRDMPFMLAALGLVKPDGSSRKPDHDRFNELLNRVYDDVVAEISARFDPTFDDFDAPGTTLDNTATFQILPIWREAVWRNAELLSRARTPEARRVAAEEIEGYAATQAGMIRAGTGYRRELGQSSAARDAHCERHGRTPARPAAARRAESAGMARLQGRRLRASGRGTVAVRLRCPQGPACRGTLTLRLGRRAVARRAFSVRAGTTRRYELRLARSARDALRRRGRIAVRAVVRSRDGGTVRARVTIVRRG